MKFVRRVSVCLLSDGNGKLLLQHRDANAPRFPSHWGLFGGEIDHMEMPNMTAMRELFEEASLKLPLSFHSRQELEMPSEGLYEYYVYKAILGPDTQFIVKEGDGACFFSAAEIENLKIIPPDRRIALEFLSG